MAFLHAKINIFWKDMGAFEQNLLELNPDKLSGGPWMS